MAEDGMETENVDLEPDMEDSRDDDVEEMDDDASVDVLETSFCENLEVHIHASVHPDMYSALDSLSIYAIKTFL